MRNRTTWHATVVAMAMAPGFVVQAETWYVDDDNCPGPGSGGPADPYCSIQTAIDAALEGDEIVVAPGTYFEMIDLHGKAVRVRSSGGPLLTTIDAQGAGSVVTCASGEGPDTVLEGFTITGGTGTDPDTYADGAETEGGGMLNVNSGPAVINCVFSGNTATTGGGMYSYDGSPTVIDCAFTQNTATWGGGMCNDDGSRPMVVDCHFDGNWAEGRGGGIYNVRSSPTVSNCRLSDNESLRGAGMYNYSSDPIVMDCTIVGAPFGDTRAGGGMFNFDSDPTVMNCTFTGHRVYWDGGGMLNKTGSSPIVVGCLFSGNTAQNGVGGGIVSGFSSLAVTNCTFRGNSAVTGGGMADLYGTDAVVTNCAFTGNDAELGGGLYSRSSSPAITNCTFAENSALVGSALAVDSAQRRDPGALLVTACILWNGGDEIWQGDGSTIDVTYSDVRGGWPGTGNIDADPMFLDAAALDFGLSPGSPCIDAGDNTAVPAGIVADLDGNPRFVDDPQTVDTGHGVPPLVDLGALEFQGVSCPWDCQTSPDGSVSVVDFLKLLAQWGTADSCDFDGSGVDFYDCVELLTNWGPCP